MTEKNRKERWDKKKFYTLNKLMKTNPSPYVCSIQAISFQSKVFIYAQIKASNIGLHLTFTFL